MKILGVNETSHDAAMALIDNEKIFESIFQEHNSNTPDSKFEIVGSYRRGLKSSGDIDVIITAESPKVFINFIDELIKKKIEIPAILLEGDEPSAPASMANSAAATAVPRSLWGCTLRMTLSRRARFRCIHSIWSA